MWNFYLNVLESISKFYLINCYMKKYLWFFLQYDLHEIQCKLNLLSLHFYFCVFIFSLSNSGNFSIYMFSFVYVFY